NARPSQAADAVFVLALSARTASALRMLVGRYADHLLAKPELSLAEVCFTAAAGRAVMKHRVAVVAADRAELIRALSYIKEEPRWAELPAQLAAYGATRISRDSGIVGIVHGTREQAAGAAAAFVQGAALRADPGLVASKVALPTYPFEHMRCWVDGPA